MQTIEKALHQPMPFTTGGQTISDRLTAAKHSLAGSQLGKTICKATTEELMAPKKKHLDYLLHCTNEPNVSIPSMANLLIERTQHPNWTVVYKALITIHNIMCYGNERFSQYLASCNTTFNLGNFLDKNSTSGYDMSQHVRRYGKYIGEKIATYRVCAFDFCKVKRGREDGLLRTMHTDKLLKTLPILQNQIDALLEFQVSASELNNGVINCSFILLFRDLIRLFACYNDGIINLLEKYFDMNKKQCRDALDTYKGFLTRLDKVSEFLRVAESVGIDRGEIPDLTRAPASLLEALEAHLIHLEGGRVPPSGLPGQYSSAQSQVANFSMSGGFQTQPHVGDAERTRYIELEKERLRQFEEQKRQQGASSVGASSNFNPFAAEAMSAQTTKKTSDDLLDLFNAPAQPSQPQMDPTNPFAQFTSPNAQNSVYPSVAGVVAQPVAPAPSTVFSETNGHSNGFQADFVRAFSSRNTNDNGGDGITDANPFLNMGATTAPPGSMWQPEFSSEHASMTNAEAADAHTGIATSQATNPFGNVSFQAQGGTPQHLQHGDAQRFASANSSSNNSPIPLHLQQQQFSQNVDGGDRPVPPPTCAAETISSQPKSIYEQTPFSQADGSYSGQSPFPVGAMQTTANMPRSNEQTSALESAQLQQQGTFDPFSTQQQGQAKIGSDIDSALSNLADNLSISGNNQGRPVQWGGTQQQGTAQMQIPSSVPAPSVGAPPMASYGAPSQYTTPFGQYAPQAYPGGHMPQWQVQPHVFPAPQHTQGPPSGYPVYGGAAMGYGQVSQPHPQPGQDPFGF
ncbi:hypothetical protein V3C99_004548 [Haemonchus contortus]